ncbi:carbon-nitrogen hydrolase family protein [Undibacterium luofuense]|uniref:Carbon-nitrogen hydrolase family protein n=1 Tax=Undibacterium luofuense TaxID=2828733 RepID=A0A941I7M1_9BURK|nr:carbon-nitrogen hydrolase family protein [Undibacterium luofuense]MBR7782815.1 carbon-nitrogen hydrolase family protein [Undibacterium luofuense]
MKVAAIQMVSATAPEVNCLAAESLIQQAAEQGAQCIVLPEYWPLMGKRDTDKLTIAEPFGDGPLQQWMSEKARQHRIWLVGGTIPLVSPDDGKVFNSTLVYGPDGAVQARYDKIHLFGFQKEQESYEESRTITAGTQPVSFSAGDLRIGLSICYDVRFPELYRAMGACDLLLVPAAFTYTTGQAHWEILLRTRAVENQCYVLACGQGGLHENGRRTWGHSMLIDPWGKIIDVLPEGEGIVSGILDTALIADIRASLPALNHRKLR